MKHQLSPDATIRFGSIQPIVPATVYYFDLRPAVTKMGLAGLISSDRLRAVCEKHVRSIAGTDLVLFSEHGFHLVVTSCEGKAAAALANFINVSLLMLLFGTEHLTSDQDITLFRQVDGEDLPAVANRKMQYTSSQWHNDEQGDEYIEAQEHTDGDPFATLARDGLYIEQGVELTFYPVHDLRRRAVSALFCAPTFAGAVFGHHAFQGLKPAELPYVDRAILNHSVAFANRLAEAGMLVAIGAAVSFETLAWSKSREIYQRALRAAKLAPNAQLILKLEDIPSGTPADRITQIVTSLRPFARHTFVHLPNKQVDLTMTGRMGASGFVLSLQRRAPLPEVLADSKWLSRAAMTQNAMSCIDYVESDEVLAVVRSADIRFAVGNVFGAETLRGTAPIDEVRGVIDRAEVATAKHLNAVI
jgi:hypothetical protein